MTFNLFSKEKYRLSKCFERYFMKLEADALLAPNSIAKYKEIYPHIIRILDDMDVRKINSETVIRLKHELNDKHNH